MANFNENWAKKEKNGLGQATRDAVKGPQPIRPQIQKATRELRQEIGKLENTSSRLKQKEKAIFGRTVGAVQSRNEQMGKAYANELAEVRKMQGMISQSKMALEQLSTRLDTVTDIGDFTASLAPAIEAVKRLRRSLGTSMPEAQSTFVEVGEVLNTMMADFGQLSGIGFSLGEASEDSEKILAEATAVAENRMTKNLPDVPDSTSSLFDSTS